MWHETSVIIVLHWLPATSSQNALLGVYCDIHFVVEPIGSTQLTFIIILRSGIQIAKPML